MTVNFLCSDLPSRAAILLLVVALFGGAAPARAQEAARQALLEEARAASTRGDHRAAVDAAVRARALGPNPSVHAFLAQEYAALGDYARALDSASTCIQGARADATLTGRDRFIARCTTLRDDAQRHVVRLIVHPPSPPPAGLVIRVNQQELVEALWDAETFVNSGTAVVEARADGYEPFVRNVLVPEGGGTPVGVSIELTPTVASYEVGPEPDAVVTLTPPTRTPPTTTTTMVHERPGQRTDWLPAALGVTAGAVVLLGVGIALHVYAEDRVTTYNRCVQSGGLNCPEIRSQYDSGMSAAIAFDVLGGIAAAGAVTLFVLQATLPPATTAAEATTVRCGAGVLAVECRAEF
jgi:hypothetical protein